MWLSLPGAILLYGANSVIGYVYTVWFIRVRILNWRINFTLISLFVSCFFLDWSWCISLCPKRNSVHLKILKIIIPIKRNVSQIFILPSSTGVKRKNDFKKEDKYFVQCKSIRLTIHTNKCVICVNSSCFYSDLRLMKIQSHFNCFIKWAVNVNLLRQTIQTNKFLHF